VTKNVHGEEAYDTSSTFNSAILGRKFAPKGFCMRGPPEGKKKGKEKGEKEKEKGRGKRKN
jgi:hypothetical protein